MSSTARVKALRDRRAEQGMFEFRMRVLRSEWEQMEQVRQAVHAMRGLPPPIPRPPALIWRMWLKDSERELAQAMRDSLMEQRA